MRTTDRDAEVVYLLSTLDRGPGDDRLDRWPGLAGKCLAYIFNDSPGGIIFIAADENHFVARIILPRDGSDVFLQTFIHATQRNKDRCEWSEVWMLPRQFRSQITNEANAAAKRKQAQP